MVDIQMVNVQESDRIQNPGDFCFCDIDPVTGLPTPWDQNGEPPAIALMIPGQEKVVLSLWPVIGPNMTSFGWNGNRESLCIHPEVGSDTFLNYRVVDHQLVSELKTFKAITFVDGQVVDEEETAEPLPVLKFTKD